MKQEIKNKFPQWCRNRDYDTIFMTNDFDSLLGSKLLEEGDKKIRFFFDNKKVYKLNNDYKSLVAVDCDLVKGKCWGNHVTMMSKDDKVNVKSANVNNIYKINARNNYTDKYSGSTTLQIMAYHDMDVSYLSSEAKKVLLCIDSHYIGLKNDRFKQTQFKWLRKLGYPELIEVAENTTVEEFKELQNRYNLKSEIYINVDGYLETDIKLNELSRLFDIDLSLPKEKFTYIGIEMGTAIQNITFTKTKEELTDRKLFIYVQTYRRSGLFNYYI